MTPFSARAEMVDFPQIKIQALNKSTARTETFTAKVGETIEYGSLFIKIQACRKSEPLDKPENAAFLQIWEVPIGKEKSEWAFSGWMFSSSPAVSAMDHAIYDVWVLECFDPNAKKIEPVNKIIVNDEEFDQSLDEDATDENSEPSEAEEGADTQGNEGTTDAAPETTQTTTESIDNAITSEIINEDNTTSTIINAEPLDDIIDDIVTYE
jgi:hypothetical protein